MESSISSLPEMELATNYAKKLAETMAQTKEIVDQEITAAQARQQTGYNHHHATQNHGFKEKAVGLTASPGSKKRTVSKIMCKISRAV